jgi:hypothetical protein
MERMPKQFVNVEYERERLEIDGPSTIVIRRNKGKARVEIRPLNRKPNVKKMVDDTPRTLVE